MAVRRKTMQTQQGLKQKIYENLKHKLIQCVYAPGSELNELILTEEYGVSRTPVREAISRLEMEGYVRVIPKKGIYIPPLSIEDALHIFQTRIEIEPVTLKMAIPFLSTEKLLDFRNRFISEESDIEKLFGLDTDMHLYLIDQCRNPYLIGMMHKLFDDNTRIVIATGQNEVKIHNARREHIAVLESLISMKSPDESAELLRSHIMTCRSAALKYFSSDEYRIRSNPSVMPSVAD